MRHKTKLSRRLKYTTTAIKKDLFGDLDFDGFCNMVLACATFSTVASLALYLFCFYCI